MEDMFGSDDSRTRYPTTLEPEPAQQDDGAVRKPVAPQPQPQIEPQAFGGPLILTVADVDQLIRRLGADGRTVIGPKVDGPVIGYQPIGGAADLPSGWGDEQGPGHYRLRRRDDDALFGYALAPTSWKRYVFPARSELFRARREDGALAITTIPPARPRYAFIGMRACEIAALDVQRRVFMRPEAPDPTYAANTQDMFVVAVSCGSPAATCFCVSAGTGPEASGGYDIRLTEVNSTPNSPDHYFVANAGTQAGADVLAQLACKPASDSETGAATQIVQAAATAIGQGVKLDDVHELLARNRENPRWDDVAARCLSCGNCTMSCPTCFCSDVVDENPIGDDGVVRARVWASCFGVSYSQMHGGNARTSTSSRYRQWLTHKMSTWVDQFDVSGCVGCGRCITTCPVGIDIRTELEAIRATDTATKYPESVRPQTDEGLAT